MKSIPRAKMSALRSSVLPSWVTTAWIVFLAFLPISWLPTVSGSTLVVLRFVLGVLALGGTFVFAPDRRLPSRLAGPLGLVVVLVSSGFAIVQSDAGTLAARRVAEFAVAFAVLWGAFVYQRNGGGLARTGMWAALIVGFASVVVLLLAGSGVELVAPGATESTGAIDRVAFGWSRTQWSAGVSLMVPFALYGLLSPSGLGVRVGSGVSLVALFASQVVTAGRSGIVASLVAVVMVVGVRWGWRALVAAVAGAVGVVASLALLLTERLRIDRLSGDAAADFSAGRFDLYRFGLEQMVDRPVTGWGFGVPALPADGRSLEIHNQWLRVGAEGGLIALAGVLAVVVEIGLRAIRAVVRVRRAHGPLAAMEPASLAAVFVAGLVISLFEPNVVLGSMTMTAAWWAAAGAAVAIDSLHDDPSTRAR